MIKFYKNRLLLYKYFLNIEPILTNNSTTNVIDFIICQDDNSQSIMCTPGFINILKANYGRSNNQTCCYGSTVTVMGPSVACMNTQCYLNETVFFKKSRDFKSFCTISIPSTKSCHNTYKYLEVSWKCIT